MLFILGETDQKIVRESQLGELAFFPGFYLMSLEESIQTYLELRETDAWASLGSQFLPVEGEIFMP